MATPVNDSYTAPSGEQINAGQWAVADYDASAALSSDVAGSANPGDTFTITANLTNVGLLSLGGTVFVDEIEDGNLTLVPGSATTNVGSVTQDDTRVEIAIGTLATSAIITYQLTVDAAMPDGYVSSRATLDAANLAIEFSNLLIELVAASVGDQDISNNWDNLGFETDVLAPGNSQTPAASWSIISAENPSDGGPVLEGSNLGKNNVLLTFAFNNAAYAASPGTYRITYDVRRTPSETSTFRCSGQGDFDGNLNTSTAWGRAEPPTYEWGRCANYVALKDFNSTSFNLGIRGDEFPTGTGRVIYIDDVKVTKLASWHPQDLVAVNASNVRGAGIAYYADPYTMGNPVGAILGKQFVAGNAVGRMAGQRFSNFDNYLFQGSTSQRPSWQANGGLRFDGIDDWMPPNPSPDTNLGIGNSPFTVAFRAIFNSRPGGNRYVLQFKETNGHEYGIRINDVNDGELLMRSGAVAVVIPDLYTTYLGQDIIILCHFETGNSFAEIYGGANFPAPGLTHFEPHDCGIGAYSPVGTPNAAPAMDFFGMCLYPGWDVALNDKIAMFLNSIDGSQP